jgi:hypothetical protein
MHPATVSVLKTALCGSVFLLVLTSSCFKESTTLPMWMRFNYTFRDADVRIGDVKAVLFNIV